MENFCNVLIVLILIFSVPHSFAAPEASLDKENSGYVHELIFDEISAIKRKVWVDISAEIQSLSKKVYSVATNQNSCNCSQNSVANDCSNHERVSNIKYIKLLKGFNTEKFKSRETVQRLNNALSKISELEKELDKFKVYDTEEIRTQVKEHTDKLEITADDVNSIQASVDEVKLSNEKLRTDLSIINNTCSKLDETASDNFHGPSFISDWILMRSQDQDYVQRFVRHGLGVLPYKVEVQIRATAGPNSGWTFHGDPAFQSDDDYGEVYGGIVYLYNETHVILVAPNKSNNQNAGVVINTGSANFRRTGNNHQTAEEAYVRVKVWAPSDFPKPDFKTDWLPLDITKSSLSYYELGHGLNGYPSFINVQVRCNSSSYNVVSEGLGATMMHRKYSNAGGVVYAFNDKTVRLWSGYLTSTSDSGHYRLIGYSDGWGSGPIAGVNILQGEFRILSWDHDESSNNIFDFETNIETNTEFPEWSAFEHVSVDTDLLSFYVEATDGPNKGYRFRGYGNSQSIDSPFGGVVYAFNSAGEFRIWNPNATTDGYLIHVHSPYGNGRNVQASNDAQYVGTLIKATKS